MRIFDPYGNATDALRELLANADVVSEPVPFEACDAAIAYGTLDRVRDADSEMSRLMGSLRRDNGRLYAALRFAGVRDEGRHRNMRPVDFTELLRRHGRIVDYQGDENGATAVLERFERKGKVAIVTGPGLQWDPTQITTTGLGGLETSAWRIAREFAKFGYDVTLYGGFSEERDLLDVMLRNRAVFNPLDDRDLLVSFHHADVFEQSTGADTNLLWLTNAGQHHGLTESNAQNIDRVLALSGWHSEEIAESYPWLDRDKITTIRNGIHHSFFEETGLERERRVVFSSSPDRGLSVLLDVWPSVLERVPDARLVCTYPWYADGFRTPWLDRVLEAAESTEGVSLVRGGMSQDHLATLLLTSQVWAHPAVEGGGEKVHETSCIAAMEAQAAGCVVVAGGWGGLAETARGCSLLAMTDDEDIQDLVYADDLMDALIAGLTDETLQAQARVLGREAMKHHDWKGVADMLVSFMPPVSVPLDLPSDPQLEDWLRGRHASR